MTDYYTDSLRLPSVVLHEMMDSLCLPSVVLHPIVADESKIIVCPLGSGLFTDGTSTVAIINDQ